MGVSRFSVREYEAVTRDRFVLPWRPKIPIPIEGVLEQLVQHPPLGVCPPEGQTFPFFPQFKEDQIGNLQWCDITLQAICIRDEWQPANHVFGLEEYGASLGALFRGLGKDHLDVRGTVKRPDMMRD